MGKLTHLIFTKVLADGTSITINKTGANPTIFSSLSSLVNFVINLVFGVGISLALLFVIIGGIKYITSQGDQGKAEEARNTITNAIIGAVVIIAFRALIGLALNVIGIQGNIDSFLGS